MHLMAIPTYASKHCTTVLFPIDIVHVLSFSIKGIHEILPFFANTVPYNIIVLANTLFSFIRGQFSLSFFW